jgi:cytochrome c biogenesis protein CcdA
MPLSEHEQRILEEIERRLVADDPKFAREVAGGSAEGAALKRVKRAVAGFVLGFVLLIVGLFKASLLVYFGIVAFAVMVASAAVIASGIKQVSQQRGTEPAARQGWFARMEDRWKKRYEGGDST